MSSDLLGVNSSISGSAVTQKVSVQSQSSSSFESSFEQVLAKKQDQAQQEDCSPLHHGHHTHKGHMKRALHLINERINELEENGEITAEEGDMLKKLLAGGTQHDAKSSDRKTQLLAMLKEMTAKA